MSTLRVAAMLALFLPTLLIIDLPLHGQVWESVGADLRDAVWLDNQTVIAVGNRGQIYRSQDAGTTWSLQNLDLSADLVSVTNTTTGLLVGGSNGKTFLSVDKGRTWSQVGRIESPYLIADLAFDETATVGVAANTYGIIYRTVDGGKNWVLVDTLGLGMSAVVPKDSETFACIGSSGVWISTSSGNEWAQKEIDGEYRLYSGLWQSDTLLVVGVDFSAPKLGALYRITTASTEVVMRTISDVALSPRGIGAFVDGTLLVAGGPYDGSDQEKVIFSSDGGDSWRISGAELTSDYTWLENVSFAPDGANGVAVGGQGLLVVIEVGEGAEIGDPFGWRTVSHSPIVDYVFGTGARLRLMDIDDIDSSTLVVTAPYGDVGRLIRSKDNGVTWSSFETPRLLGSTEFRNPDDGVGLVMPNVFSVEKSMVYFTDTGASSSLERVEFNHDEALRPQVPLVRTPSGSLCFTSKHHFFRSEDWGRNWTRSLIDDGIMGAYSLELVDDSVMYCAGDDTYELPLPDPLVTYASIYRSADGGRTWEVVERTSTLNGNTTTFKFEFLTPTHGYRGSWVGKIDVTHDGGRTWSEVADFPGTFIMGIDMLTESLGFAYGIPTFLAKTEDGGATWSKVELWEERPDDSQGGFLDLAVMPDNRTIYLSGTGIVLRGTFDGPISSVHHSERDVREERRLSISTGRNPVTTGLLSLDIEGVGAEGGTLKVYDAVGRVLLSRSVSAHERNLTLITEAFPVGLYRCVLGSGGQRVETTVQIAN